MKYNDEHDKNELFFKKLASLYVAKEGGILKNELEEIEKENNMPYPLFLDRKVKGKIASMKFKKMSYRMMPFVASLLIFAIYFSNLPTHTPDDMRVSENQPPPVAAEPALVVPAAPAAPKDNPPAAVAPANPVVLLSAKLPQGYELTDVDYDREKTIFYIENDMNNSIVLTTEPFAGDMEKDVFQEIEINDTKAYALVKNDYSVLKYEKDDVLYTLTSRYNYKDLIEISKNIV